MLIRQTDLVDLKATVQKSLSNLMPVSWYREHIFDNTPLAVISSSLDRRGKEPVIFTWMAEEDLCIRSAETYTGNKSSHN